MAYFSAVSQNCKSIQIAICRFLRFGLILLFASALSACSGAGSDLASTLGLKSNAEKTDTQLAQKGTIRPVAFAPLVGVPSGVSTKLLSAVKTAASAKRLPVTDNTATAGYLVRGYLVATPETIGAKLSYIWDINDNKGVRIHRVLGNEIIKGKKTNNGWSLVNDQVIARVADASSQKLNSWFVNQARAQNKNLNKRPAGDTSPKRISPIAEHKEGTPADPVITGAVNQRPLSRVTFVKPVIGAPGDGRISLTNALRRELKKNGIPLTQQKVAGGYTVQGKVTLGKIEQGRQKIQITWNVYDQKGQRVGTVSQKNAVPKGSLNGVWGPTAEAAASAAAKGIVKLLPSNR